MIVIRKNPNIDELLKDCPVQHTLNYIGGKWRFGILWNLREEKKRFGELKRELAGISEKMLIQELKHFEGLGVIERKSFGEVPPKVEYSLTEKGKTLLPIAFMVVDWGMKSLASTANREIVAE